MTDHIDGSTGSAGSGSPSYDILAGGSDVSRGRRPKLSSTLSIVGVVVVVVAAGGGLFAYHRLASSGSMPDTLAPASSIAFAELDLDPAAAEKVAAYRFEQKFPTLPHAANADAMKDALLTELFSDAGADGDSIDYPTQIKPWLGDRVAIDEFLGAGGDYATVGIVQTTDSAKATADLTALTSTNGGAFVVSGDYVVFGSTLAVVNDAVAQAGKATIDDNPNYAKDVATLHSDRIVTAWWDAGATAQALSGKLSDLLGEFGTAASPSTSGSALQALSKAGRVVIGLHLDSDAAELEGRVIGASDTGAMQSGNAVSALGALPGSSIAGFSLANPSAAVKAELAAVQNGGVDTQLQKDLDTASSQLGISVPSDLENLLGSSLTAGLTSLPTGGNPPGFTVITKPTDPTAGAATAQTLVADAGKNGLTLQTTASGDTVVVSGQPPATGATLADQPAFSSMFGSMPTADAAAGYVDLAKIWAAEPAVPAAAQHLGAVGFVVGRDATSPLFDIKLTVS